MEQKLIDLVYNKLKNKFGEDIFSADQLYDYPTFTVRKDKILDILKFLYEELGFKFLTTLCGIHFPDAKEQLGVIYHLHNLQKNYRIRIKIFTDLNDPSVPSATSLFEAANWMERETYDFFGIEFKGHPNLKRILNMEELVGFPLRKEYPLEDQTREDKDDTMFGRG